MNKLKEIWQNKKVRFGVVTTLYLLWFVLWTQNLLWILGVAVIYDYYFTRYMDKLFLNKYRSVKAKNNATKVTFEWAEALLYAVIVVIPVKLFFFGLYVIPSSSMEGTLLVGDYVYVDRTAYGPKMPITPISFPFVQHTMPFTENTKSFVDWIQFDYKRLAGHTSPMRGDVVVFNFPAGDTVALIEPNASYYDLIRNYGREQVLKQSEIVFRPVDKRENYIKRMVAMPGDTLTVVDNLVFIDGVKQPVPERLIKGNLTNLPVTDATFPHEPKKYPWTHLNYGPLWIPEQGATVALDIDNLPLYERIIKNYEENTLEVKNNQIFINGTLANSYTFKMNYYFMMGDNRDNSLDSRYWGFVPDDHIEGKAAFVWLSVEEGKSFFNGLRFNKMFKAIN